MIYLPTRVSIHSSRVFRFLLLRVRLICARDIRPYRSERQRQEPGSAREGQLTSTSFVKGIMYSLYNLTTSSTSTLCPLSPLSGKGSPSLPNSAPYHLAFFASRTRRAASTAGFVMRDSRIGGFGVRMWGMKEEGDSRNFDSETNIPRNRIATRESVKGVDVKYERWAHHSESSSRWLVDILGPSFLHCRSSHRP